MRVAPRSPLAPFAGVLYSLLISTAAHAAPPQEKLSASYDRALLQTAQQLEEAAARTRSMPKGKIFVPEVRLPRSPLDGTASGTPSLDGWLRSQIGRIGKEKSAKARVGELRDLAAALRRAAEPGSELGPGQDPRDVAASILAQSAYQPDVQPAPTPRHSVFQALFRRLGRWVKRLSDRLQEFVQRMFGKTVKKPIVDQIVVIVVVALVAAAAAYLVFLFFVLFVRRRKQVSTGEGTPLPETVEPDAVYELGVAAAARGEYAQAVSLLFRASLAVFDRSGKLPYDRSLTPGEYRRAVRRSLAAASSYFDDIATTFVLAVFAERSISKEQFLAADLAYRSMRPLVAA